MKLEANCLMVQRVIQTQEHKVKKIARKYRDKPYFFFFGRGMASGNCSLKVR